MNDVFPHVGHVVENSCARCRATVTIGLPPSATATRWLLWHTRHWTLRMSQKIPSLQVVREVARRRAPADRAPRDRCRPTSARHRSSGSSPSASACRGSRVAGAGDRTRRCRRGSRSRARPSDSVPAISSPAAKYVTVQPSIAERFTVPGSSVPCGWSVAPGTPIRSPRAASAGAGCRAAPPPGESRRPCRRIPGLGRGRW